jgi:hypothetical protein
LRVNLRILSVYDTVSSTDRRSTEMLYTVKMVTASDTDALVADNVVHHPSRRFDTKESVLLYVNSCFSRAVDTGIVCAAKVMRGKGNVAILRSW